jgi:hypothetical protein
MFEGSCNDNLAKVIMEALTIHGGCQDRLPKSSCALGLMVLMSFKAQKMVLQNTFMTPMPLNLLVHCMAHYINLVVQTLSGLILVVQIDSLLQCLYFYFAHSPKKHLEFTKISKVKVTKGNKILRNVTRWILMLKPC